SNCALTASIEFPADLDDGVAVIEQEPVSDLAVGGIGHRPIEDVQCDCAAAVHDVEQRESISPARIAGTENHEVSRHLDLACGVARRLVEIRYDLISFMRGIDGEVNRSG